MDDVRIASAAEIGGAARLEGAWLRAFGPGDRPAGWFARKLARERVDDELSQVAIATGSDPRSPRSWLGFVLAGRLPSLGGAVRTAGTAVMPDMRRRGIGSALLHALDRAAAHAGAPSVQIVADASAILYYERLGFQRVRDVVTILLPACGEPADLKAPTPPITPTSWTAAPDGLGSPVELAAWTPEAWEGSVDRRTIDLAAPRARALVSREGTAWLVHRCLAEKDAHLRDVLLALRRALPSPAPILVPHLDDAMSQQAQQVQQVQEVSSITGARVVQRGALLSRPSLVALHPVAPRR
jgi:ribosomal protein S18 acetylase RimI-like enzyme